MSLVHVMQDSIVIFLYGMIAFQFFQQGFAHTPARKSFRLLMIIFLFCAFNGYFFDAIVVLTGNHNLEIWRIITMVPLIIASAWYALTGQVALIKDAFHEADKRAEENSNA